MQEINIKTDFITLGQLLKITDVVGSGGQAKFFLSDHPKDIQVNKENDNRRGRKLYPNDVIQIKNFGEFVISK